MKKLGFSILLLVAASTGAWAQSGKVMHGMAMHGDLKYGPDAKNFDYVNPNAPKGGAVRFSAMGTFDTLNPFVLKGDAAVGLGLVFDTLTIQSSDEAFSEYGLLAQSMEVPDDRSWVVFTLRPEAKWHDGKPITVDDVIFSFDILKSKGRPNYRLYYADVIKAEKIADNKVKFTFKDATNRELPLIIGQLPILPKHYWQGREFDKTTLEAPLGSGRYKIASVDTGRSITYERVENYWGKDLWLNRGRDNFQSIRYDYYRDPTVILEAFKAGQFDIRSENIARNWATGYKIPAVERGLIKMEEIKHELTQGMQGFAMNLRKDFFQDRRVRMALNYLYDFEWANKTLFYGSYTRTQSYFSNSELASRGLPSKDELVFLEKYRGKVPDELFTKEFKLPVTDGSGENREGLREALRLFKEAGWEIKDRKLTNLKTGKPLDFEILLNDPSFERVVLPYVQRLERAGIQARVRTVDSAQYQRRMEDYDFDVTVDSFGQSLSPGNEQRQYWSSASAKQRGSENSIGIVDPVIDELVELVIGAPDRAQLIVRTRVLDRVLLWGYYIIPNWHLPAARVVYWDRFGHPSVTAKYGPVLTDTWWVDPAKDAALKERLARGDAK